MRCVRLTLLSIFSVGRAVVLPQRAAPTRAAPAATRRDALQLGLATCLATASARPAAAFDNAVPEYAEYADKPKRRGQPQEHM